MKRILGVLVALAAIGAAAASIRGVDAAGERTVRAEAAKLALGQLTRARDALDNLVGQAEPRVASAVARPQVTGALAILRPADPIAATLATLADGLKNESWAEAYRREFPIAAVSMTPDAPDPDLVVGAEPSALPARELIEKARAGGLNSAVLGSSSGPLVVVADRIVTPNRPPTVLLLAKPISDAMAVSIAERAGAAVVFSDEKKIWARGGAAEETARIATLVGRQADAITETPGVFMGQGNAWAGAAHVIAPGFWLWIHADNAAAIDAAKQTATTTKSAIWGGAGLLALLSVFFAFRAGGAAQANTPLPTSSGGVQIDSGAQLTGTAPGMGVSTRTNQSGGARAVDATSPYGATQALASTPPPGNVFGRYSLLDLLGEGGMARVFTAVTFGAEGFRRKFVVKRLRPELSGESAMVAQFIDEAKLASTLVHSNVVPVFDFGKVGDEYYMATEYILGRDLGKIAERIREKTGHGFPIDLLLLATQETLKALDYAHTKRGDDNRPLGIVHRDVSPANVLVSARGEVKLFDFGIVKAEGRVTKTQAGVVKGNVSFMAPEQARGAHTDARADLFSLGLVMFYCATGEVLYQGGTTYELLVKAATGPGQAELARIAQLPAPLPALLAGALATDPAQRFSTATDFMAAIAPHLRVTTSDLAKLVNEYFAADFRQEEARFTGTMPAVGANDPPAGASGAGGA